jgi:6-phosphogluconolactonase (cycloisomerase 2 family)
MFEAAAKGLCLFLLLSLYGCVISPRRGVTPPGGTGTGQLYVVNQSANSILRFSAATAANGNIAPNANITGAATQLSNPQYIFLDAANNRLYVANTGGSSILVFDNASTLNGNVAPTRTITSANLATPTDVALDSGRDLLYVADNLEVAVFANAHTINSVTGAIRVIQLAFTPGAIHLDPTNDRLFVADPTSNAIDVFDAASTLNGTVPANRTISGTGTQLAQPLGLQVDGAGRLIVSNFAPPSITIYANAAKATGNVGPIGVIAGSNTTLTGPTELALDSTTNSGELYVGDPFGAHVPVFSSISTVAGTINAVPNRNITGANTLLTGTANPTSRGVALDTTR